MLLTINARMVGDEIRKAIVIGARELVASNALPKLE